MELLDPRHVEWDTLSTYDLPSCFSLGQFASGLQEEQGLKEDSIGSREVLGVPRR